jgi:YggT family protein
MPLLFAIAYYALDAIIYLLLAVAILSWFPIDPRNKWIRLLHSITDPILHPIRALVPPIGGFSLDILIAVLLLGVIQRVLHSALTS